MNEPRIALISRPSLREVSDLVAEVGARWRIDESASSSELLIEYCGRICYMSFGDLQSPRTNREYIRNLIKNGHHSVLEHASWTFLASNVTRSFTHQLVRHRVGFSYSQLSQQYVDQSTIDILDPEEIDDPDLMNRWQIIKGDIENLYRSLLAFDGNDPKEVRRKKSSFARFILPNSTTTRIAFTANARSLRHFLEIRGSIEGDLEMRRFSAALLEILREEAPVVFEDFEVRTFSDGYPIVYLNR